MPVDAAQHALQPVREQRDEQERDREPEAVQDHERQAAELAVLREGEDGAELRAEAGEPSGREGEPEEQAARRAARHAEMEAPLPLEPAEAQHPHGLQREHHDDRRPRCG